MKIFSKLFVGFILLLLCTYSCQQDKEKLDTETTLQDYKKDWPFEPNDIGKQIRVLSKTSLDSAGILAYAYLDTSNRHDFFDGKMVIGSAIVSIERSRGNYAIAKSTLHNMNTMLNSLDSTLEERWYAYYLPNYIDLQAIYITTGQYDSAIIATEIAEKLYHDEKIGPVLKRQSNYENNRSILRTNKAIVFFRKGDLENAKKTFEEEVEAVKLLGDSLGANRYLGSLSTIAREQGDLKSAMKYALESQSFDPDNYRTLDQLGLVYSDLGDYDRALECYEELLNQSKKAGDQSYIASTLNRIGFNYQLRSQFDSAFNYFKESYRLDSLSGDIDNMAYNLTCISGVLVKQEKFQEALGYIEEGFRLIEGHGIFEERIRLSIDKVRSLQGLNRLNEATKLIDDIESIIESDNEQMKKDAYDVLQSLYAELGDYKTSREYLLEYLRIQKNITEEDVQNQVAKVKFDYELKLEKKRFDDEKKKQNIAFQAELDQQRNTQIVLFFGILVLVIITGLILRLYRLKTKTNLELDQKNHRLEELSSYKQGLTQMIAHDMKNPLNSVLTLSKGAPSNQRMKEIEQSGHLMLQMVTNMLDVQKFEETTLEPKLGDYALAEIVNQAKYQVELLLHAKAINFQLDIDQKLGVYADNDMIIRVFVNLFTNAIKYTPNGGQVIVSVTNKMNRLLIKVSDSGTGIHKKDLPHIFEKFWQVDAKEAGMVQSTGLGLAYCKMAINLHQGEIIVESEVGKGTTFTFDLQPSKKEIAPTFVNSSVPMIEKFSLSPEEKEILLVVIDEIRHIPLHKPSSIHKVLSDMQVNSEALEHWKQGVLDAAFNFNEKAYKNLIDQLTD